MGERFETLGAISPLIIRSCSSSHYFTSCARKGWADTETIAFAVHLRPDLTKGHSEISHFKISDVTFAFEVELPCTKYNCNS